jgi:hypothetical protein
LLNWPDCRFDLYPRFPPPWSIEEGAARFVVRDHDKQALAYAYYENESGRRSSAKLLTRSLGIPDRGEHRQVAKRAAADIEGLSEAAKFSRSRRLSCPKIIRNGHKSHLRNQATTLANMTAGSDGEAVMRAYVMIAAFVALAMIAVAGIASTGDRAAGAPDCRVDCSRQAADTDNGIGTSLPVDPNNYDDGSDD